MIKDESFCQAFMLIGELAYKRGARGIKDQPGLHVIKIDDQWIAKVNPHLTTIDNVPPCEIMLEYNGFPAGLFSAKEGCIAAGSEANEGSLIDAINAAIEKERDGDGNNETSNE